MTLSNDVRTEDAKASRGISRRELGQTLLSWIALGAFPGLSTTHPICRHLLGGAAENLFDDLSPSEKKDRAFLSASQLGTLDKIAERIVPGSQKAQSAKFIDALLSVDSAETQHRFTDALAVFEGAAQRTFHRNAAALTSEQLDELLRAASDTQSVDHKSFENLKGWVVGAYYSSEIGMRELGWTPDRVFNSYPACAHAQDHS